MGIEITDQCTTRQWKEEKLLPKRSITRPRSWCPYLRLVAHSYFSIYFPELSRGRRPAHSRSFWTVRWRFMPQRSTEETTNCLTPKHKTWSSQANSSAT